MLCSFSTLVDGNSSCGVSQEYPGQLECVPLAKCRRDVSRHLEIYGLSEDPSLDNEMKLLLARAGIFSPVDVSHELVTVCPRHRAEYGIRWRTGKTTCLVPKPLIAHKSPTVKGTRKVNSKLSSFILKETGQLIAVGSPICYTCFVYLMKIEEERNLTGVGAEEEKLEGLLETRAKEEKLEGPLETGAEEEKLEGPLETRTEEETLEGALETRTEEETLEGPLETRSEEEKLEGPMETNDTRPETEESSAVSEEGDRSDSDASNGVIGALSRLKIVDETFLSPDTRSTASTQSDEIITSQATTAETQRRVLNEFLVAWDIPPLQRKWLDFPSCSESTKQRYTKRSSDIVAAVLKTISPENAGHIWRAMTSTASMNKLLGIGDISQADQRYLEALAEAYHNAESWDTRRQILSVMTGVAGYKDIATFVRGLTRYRYTVANLHRLQFGRGAPAPVQASSRIKVDLKQLDHFLCFITSPHLVQDLPFGQKHLTLSTGEVITVPNVIRTMIPQRIVRQYTQYCQESGFQPFSQRTMLRILSECSASVRKSLQGLDYYAAEGTRAFDDLISLVRKISEMEDDTEWETRTIESLKAAKLYLKGDFKVHLEKEASVPDHCVVFSLSDASDPDFQGKCQHSHEDSCEQCEALKEILREIENHINRCHFSSDDDRDEANYIMQSSKLAIRSWQCHILRSFNQDQARLDFLDLLDNETVLIVNDWAMKFLPQRYRESQSDWFGKRGISWHISVVYRRSDDQLQRQGYIHVIQSCSQDSQSVISIMQDVLRSIKAEYPDVKRAFFRQDNAGCYHSSATILACPVVSQSTGVQIMRIDFSDPQGGKGAADRLAATCKAHVRSFINEGHDVVNATQLTDALVSHGGIAGVRVACMDAITTALPVSETAKLPNVSKLNNFEFTEGQIKAWRAYGIGSGKEIKADTSTTEFENRWLESSFSPGKFKSLGYNDKEHIDEDESHKTKQSTDDIQESTTGHAVYTCPESGCTRVFQRHSALTKHLSSEKCTRSLEKHTLLDLAKLGYQQILEEGVGVVPTLRTSSVTNKQCTERLTEGWALRSAKKAYRFSEKQKAYLTAKFNIGQSTGRKIDASVVARDMRRAHGSNGERLFKSAEFLSAQQISSYFSRLSATVRQQTHEVDITAIEDEINFSAAREQVMATITLQHPIIFDQYNICAMAKEDTLKNLKVPLLQVISQGLNLSVPNPPIRRKAPYLKLLTEAISNCSCQNQHIDS